jgi:1-phosphatidylinositol-3-phosphate 5-kinase
MLFYSLLLSQLRPIQLISSSPASMKLLRDLLRQEITRLEIPDASKWMDILLSLLVRAANTVDPNCKLGDAFDIRAFVKVKKIPGGRIKDSEYVDGTVVTKNVAHKAMARKYKSPRVRRSSSPSIDRRQLEADVFYLNLLLRQIMILKFPLDYHRIERTIIDIKPVMAQEAQYLAGLVNRIAAVRPHIVLVEKHVARLALEGLLSSNIAVVRSIKEKSLSSIRRVTQADEISSLDKMTLEPRLGRCADLVIQTFDHELIKGRRKTIMRFEGCLPRLGCTLLLRGADLETLKKVKKITYFAIYAIYHLKLEMFMWFDEHGVPPR